MSAKVKDLAWVAFRRAREVPFLRKTVLSLPMSWVHFLKKSAGYEPVLGLVNIEITTYCNLQCSGCFRTIMENQGRWKNRHMSLENFEKIVDTLPSCGWLGIYGIGEPTLHPNLLDMVRIAHEERKFNTISVTSNALVHDLDYYRKLFNAGLSTLCISVDSLDPAGVQEVREGTDVEKLRDRIRVFSSAFPGKIDITIVVGRYNIQNIPSLLRELNDLGKLTVRMQPFDDMGNPSGCLSLEEGAWFVHQVPAMASSFPNLSLITLHFIPSNDICMKPWKDPYITVDGFVTPCCRITDPKVLNFGNVFTVPFNEVWHAPGIQEWRQQFIQESPGVCAGCPMYIQRRSPSSPHSLQVPVSR